ncbi:MAG: acetyl-CoA carboxylase biotin carboxyl carrier protein [Gemmatimonadales bacterium]
MDLKLVEQLLALLKSSDAQTIEVRKGFWNTTVRVSKGGLAEGPATYHVSAPGGAEAQGAGAPPPAEAPSAAPAVKLTEIKSPMVGTYYAQPEPGSDPYVRLGSRIKHGQTLCVIEAMKIMNPLDAEISGVVREVCVEDAQPVEFGQVLFRVDSHG